MLRGFLHFFSFLVFFSCLHLNFNQVFAVTQAQINSTPESLRLAWCQQQTAICSNLCIQSTKVNQCNYKTLLYQCDCANGTSLTLSPSIDQTIPYFTCLEYDWTPCFYNCPAGDQACQDKCNNQYVCGKVKLDPTKVTKSSTSITMSPSESPVIQLGQAPLSSNVSLGVYLVLLSITVVWMAMFGRTL